jgi:hypothetical protein
MITLIKRAFPAAIALAVALIGLALTGLGPAQAMDDSCAAGPLAGARALSVPLMGPSTTTTLGTLSGASGSSGTPVAVVPADGQSNGSSAAGGGGTSPSESQPQLLIADISGGGAPAGAPASQFGTHAAIASSAVPSSPVSLLALAVPLAAPLAGAVAQGNPASGSGSGPLVNVSAPVNNPPGSTTGTLVNVSAPIATPAVGTPSVSTSSIG